MNISITPELESYIEKKIKTGMYTSASEVVREGLRLLKEQDELKAIRMKELKKGTLKDQESGESSTAAKPDFSEFKDLIRSRGLKSKKA